MPTQEVTIAKIVGVSSEPIVDALARNRGSDERSTPGVLEKVLAAINKHRDRPPVVYYCMYVDYWSSGAMFQNVAVPPGLISRDADLTVMCFELSHCASAEKALSKLKRHPSEEVKLYARQLSQALMFGRDFFARGVVLAFRRPIAELVEDAQMLSASNELSPWVESILPGDRG